MSSRSLYEAQNFGKAPSQRLLHPPPTLCELSLASISAMGMFGMKLWASSRAKRGGGNRLDGQLDATDDRLAQRMAFMVVPRDSPR